MALEITLNAVKAFKAVACICHDVYNFVQHNEYMDDIKQWGIEVEDAHDLFITNKTYCAKLAEAISELESSLANLKQQTDLPQDTVDHLYCLNQCLNQAKERIKANIMPAKLNWNQKQIWILNQISNNEEIKEKMEMITNDINLYCQRLGFSLQINMYDEELTSDVDKLFELKEFIERQSFKLDLSQQETLLEQVKNLLESLNTSPKHDIKQEFALMIQEIKQQNHNTEDTQELLYRLPHLAESNTKIYDIFICHAGDSKPWAFKLFLSLSALGLNCFFDRASFNIGHDFPAELFHALTTCKCGIIILDKEFLSRKWCILESYTLLFRQNKALDQIQDIQQEIPVVPVYFKRDWDSIKYYESNLEIKSEGDNKKIHIQQLVKKLSSLSGVVNKDDLTDRTVLRNCLTQVMNLDLFKSKIQKVMTENSEFKQDLNQLANRCMDIAIQEESNWNVTNTNSATLKQAVNRVQELFNMQSPNNRMEVRVSESPILLNKTKPTTILETVNATKNNDTDNYNNSNNENKYEPENSTSSKKMVNNFMVITLLDVDETCAISNNSFGQCDGTYRYNDNLFNALIECKLKEVYLLTSYDLSSIAKSLQDEPIAAPSRLKLIKYLCDTYDIKVLGVLTTYDVVYQKGIGAYYEDRIRPFEEAVLNGNRDILHNIDYQAMIDEENEYARQYGKSYFSKGKLFKYAVEELESSLGHPIKHKGKDSNSSAKNQSKKQTTNYFNISDYSFKLLSFIVLDDRPYYLEEIEQYNQRWFDYSLLLFRVKPSLKIEEYTSPIKAFLKDQTENIQNDSDQNEYVHLTQDIFVQRLEHELYHILKAQSPNTEQQDNYIPDDTDEKGKEFNMYPQDGNLSVKNANSYENNQKNINNNNTKTTKAVIQAIVYGLGDPFSITPAIAYEIISRDGEGNEIKHNVIGNNQVIRVGNIYFKRHPEFSLIEQNVYQISRLLVTDRTNDCIVAPTQLLIIELSNSTDSIREVIPVQASLAVGDFGLDELLRIPGAIAALNNMLSEEVLLRDLPLLLNHEYYDQWLASHSETDKYSKDMRWEDQYEILLDEMFRYPISQRPIEFRIGSREEFIGDEDKYKLGGKSPLALLALLERYPILCQERLADLIHLPSVFTCLHLLYPNCLSNEIIHNAETLFDNLRMNNFSQHFLLALLTQPRDHKSDNFRVRVKYDHTKRNLQVFDLIAIDNDHAIDESSVFTIGGKMKTNMEQILNVVTVVYTLNNCLNHAVPLKVCQLIHSIDPRSFVLEWLVRMTTYCERYSAIAARFPQVFRHELHFQQQICDGFINKLLNRLNALQELVSKSDGSIALTHQHLLMQLEPLVARYYDRLSRKDQHCYEDPFTILLKLHGPDHPPNLNTTLAHCLDEHVLIIEGKNREQTTIASLLEAVPRRSLPSYRTCNDEIIPFLVAHAHTLFNNQNKAQRVAFYYFLSVLKRVCNERIHCRSFQFKLELSDAIFSFLYGAESRGFVLFLQDCKEVLLSLGDTTRPLKVMLTYPDILYSVIAVPTHGKKLLEGLIAYGCNVNIKRSIDNYSPLHLAARYNCFHSIPILVKNGAELEMCEIGGRTPLDLAIQYECKESIESLFQWGAGRTLQSDNALKFLNKYSALMPSAFIEQLLALNLDFAWSLTLQNISQTKETKEKVVISQSINQIRYIKSDIYKEIFKNGEEFPKENEHGNHSVKQIMVAITPQFSTGLHLKENPEMPGREMMVHHLAKLIFGYVTPHVALLRFSKKAGSFWKKSEIAYPVLASRSISGDSLADVINDYPERLNRLDHESVCTAIILAMLINPEDGRGANYVVQPFQYGHEMKYQIVSIDNDHSFVRPIALTSDGEEKFGKTSLQVKTILYCLDEMEKPLHVNVRKRIEKIKPFELLREWLLGLREEHKKMLLLFNENTFKDLQSNNICLPIEFQSGIVVDIYLKLTRLQSILQLKENNRITMMGILRRVIPSLGVRYSAVFHEYDNPKQRFDALTDGCFEKITVIKQGKRIVQFGTKTNTIQIREQTRSYEMEAKTMELEKKSDIETAMQQLQIVHEEYKMLKEIRNELQNGDIARFIELKSIDNKQRILAGDGAELIGLEWNEMRDDKGGIDKARQQKILDILIQSSGYLALKFDTCDSLSDKILEKLLLKCRGLSSLELKQCVTLTANPFQKFASFCISLESLILNEISVLKVLEGDFHHLRLLRLINCQQLEELKIVAVVLEHLELDRCALLKTMTSVGSPKLAGLGLTRCSSLAITQINKSIIIDGRVLDSLHYLRIRDCIAIRHSELWSKYPNLLQLYEYLDEIKSSEFIQLLDEALERKLIQINLPFHAIPHTWILRLIQVFSKRASLLSTFEAVRKGIPAAAESVETLLNCMNKIILLEQNHQIMDLLLPYGNDPNTKTEGEEVELKEQNEEQLNEIANKNHDENLKFRQSIAANENANEKVQYHNLMSHNSFNVTVTNNINHSTNNLDVNLIENSYTSIVFPINNHGNGLNGKTGLLPENNVKALSPDELMISLDNLLAMLFGDHDYNDRFCSVDGVVSIMKESKRLIDEVKIVAKLFDTCKDKLQDLNVRSSSVYAIGIIVKESKTLMVDEVINVVNKLLELFADTEYDVRRYSESSLINIAKESNVLSIDETMKILYKLLDLFRVDNANVRTCSEYVLSTIVRESKILSVDEVIHIVNLLMIMCEDSNSNSRSSSVDALSNIAKQNKVLSVDEFMIIVYTLIDMFRDQDYKVRMHSMYALCKILKDSEVFNLSLDEVMEIVTTLLSIFKDNDYARRCSEYVLTNILKESRILSLDEMMIIVNELLNLCEDSDSNVRSGSVFSLSNIIKESKILSEDEVIKIMNKMLHMIEDNDLYVRMCSVAALINLVKETKISLEDVFKRILLKS